MPCCSVVARWADCVRSCLLPARTELVENSLAPTLPKLVLTQIPRTEGMCATNYPLDCCVSTSFVFFMTTAAACVPQQKGEAATVTAFSMLLFSRTLGEAVFFDIVFNFKKNKGTHVGPRGRTNPQ